MDYVLSISAKLYTFTTKSKLKQYINPNLDTRRYILYNISHICQKNARIIHLGISTNTLSAVQITSTICAYDGLGDFGMKLEKFCMCYCNQKLKFMRSFDYRSQR